MNDARVLSVETLEHLRLALIAYAEQAGKALEAVDGEIRRAEQWLEQQMQMWKADVRKCEEEVFLAKQALARKKIHDSERYPVDCSDEENAVRRAKANLQFAEEKVEVTRNWLRQFSQELIDYEGPSRALKAILESDSPRAGALLEQKINTLESYLQMNAPQTVAPIREKNVQ